MMTWESLSDGMLHFLRCPMKSLGVAQRPRVDAASLSPAGVWSFVHLGLWCKWARQVFCCESLTIVLTQSVDFWKLPPVGVKVVGADGRVSTFHLLQIGGRSLYRPLSSTSRLAWSVLMTPTGSSGGTSCSTTVKRITPLHPASPTGTDTTPIGSVVPPTPLAEYGFSRLHSTWWPYSFNKLHHCSSCCFPTSPSRAPVSHRTSPGSRATNVQDAPKKERSPCPVLSSPFQSSTLHCDLEGARLTSQTRKLWLAGRCRDRP